MQREDVMFSSNGHSPEKNDIIQASKAIRDAIQSSLEVTLNKKLNDLNIHLERHKVAFGTGLSKQLHGEFTDRLDSLQSDLFSKVEKVSADILKTLREEMVRAISISHQNLLDSIKELVRSLPPPVFNVPKLDQPNIHVNVPESNVHVNVPKLDQPNIHVNVPKLDQPDIHVNVPELKVPEIKVDNNVTVPEIKVPEIKIPDINLPKLDTPSIQVNVPASQVAVNVPPPRRFKKQITYDEYGRPIEILEVEEQS